MSKNRLLIIFVKNLEKGKVKTRLASTVGDRKALEVYKKLVDYTRAVAASTEADKQVWYSRFIPESDGWDAGDSTKKVQGEGDLGERMYTAFQEAFNNGYEKVAIIGSDCVQLTNSLLNEAFEKLESDNVVVGPAEDGGYYLLAMDALYENLFRNISWSTSEVLSQTLDAIARLELNVYLLPELNDVDDENDWKEVKDRL